MDRTILFSYAILLSGIVSIVLGLLDYLDSHDMNYGLYVFISGFIMLLAGALMVLAKTKSKMKAIGYYALAFGVSSIILCYGKIKTYSGTVEELGTEIVIPFLLIIFGIFFILFGISYLRGNAKKLYSKVFASILFILLYISYFITNLGSGNILLIDNLVDIVTLVLFISLLLSGEVRANTEKGKRKAQKNAESETEDDD